LPPSVTESLRGSTGGVQKLATWTPRIASSADVTDGRALHYAHEYYRPSGGSGAFAEGLDFRGDPNPDYWDFFYFATSFGAASQTSDVSILTKPLRRLATLHAIISFFFNTAVLALTINLAASMF
jgi:uncharacterized membrane protein